jgi:hypothetical protein
MAEQDQRIHVTVRNLSKVQFRTFLGVLWLIAAGVQSDQVYELACLVFFAGYGIGALLAQIEVMRHGG